MEEIKNRWFVMDWTKLYLVFLVIGFIISSTITIFYDLVFIRFLTFLGVLYFWWALLDYYYQKKLMLKMINKKTR